MSSNKPSSQTIEQGSLRELTTRGRRTSFQEKELFFYFFLLIFLYLEEGFLINVSRETLAFYIFIFEPIIVMSVGLIPKMREA